MRNFGIVLIYYLQQKYKHEYLVHFLDRFDPVSVSVADPDFSRWFRIGTGLLRFSNQNIWNLSRKRLSSLLWFSSKHDEKLNSILIFIVPIGSRCKEFDFSGKALKFILYPDGVSVEMQVSDPV
jgi:hypothetical protein